MKKIFLALCLYSLSSFSIAVPEQAFDPINWTVTGRQNVIIRNPYLRFNVNVQINVLSGSIRITEGHPGCPLNTVIDTNVTQICSIPGTGRLKFAAARSHGVLSSGTYQIALE